MPLTAPAAESTLLSIGELATEGLQAQQLLEQVAARIDRVVPNDGYFISATDPETALCMGAGIVHLLPEDQCVPTWDYEFHVPDYVKFVDIPATGRSVVDLHEATGGRPDRSPRWREFRRASGYASEVRMVFTAGGAIWGIAQINRAGDAPRFSEQERAWLDRVAPLVGDGLRRSLVAQPAFAPGGRGPGVVLVDESGVVVSATAEAEAWLNDVEASMMVKTGSDFGMPFEAYAYALRVRAAAAGETEGVVPRARLRTRSGVWLLLHGSVLRETGQLAIVIEPAKASDVAPLIVEAYGLTQRELDVTRAIARGLGTGEIAGELFLSPHTVRDHVKAVFEKVGVSSRGELVAKMFAEHYSPPPH